MADAVKKSNELIEKRNEIEIERNVIFHNFFTNVTNILANAMEK